MSIYLSTDGVEPALIASNKGWSSFCAFAATLEGAGELRRLCAHGWSQNLAALAEEAEAAMDLATGDDAGVGQNLSFALAIMEDAGAVVITNGITLDEDGGESKPITKAIYRPRIQRNWSRGVVKEWRHEPAKNRKTPSPNRWVNESGQVIYSKTDPNKRKPRGQAVSNKAPKQTAEEKKAQSQKLFDEAHQLLKGYMETGKRLNPEEQLILAGGLLKLTVAQLGELKKKLGVKASGTKFDLATKLASKALSQARKPKKGKTDEQGTGEENGKQQQPKPEEQPAGGSGEGAGAGSEPAGSGRDAEGLPEAGGEVAATPEEPTTPGATEGGNAPTESHDQVATARVPASLGDVNHRLGRYEKFFQSKGQHHVAEWMGKLREHIHTVGGEEALKALAASHEGAGGPTVQYWGVSPDSDNWKNMGAFMEAYLDRNGITAVTADNSNPQGGALISALVQPDRYLEGDFKPSSDAFKDKLDEAKHLPGLEKSEDLATLIGKETTHLTPEVTAKLDETYGKGQWIVKCYDDNAAAGYGIYFPQRVEAIKQDAQNLVWDVGEHLAKYDFELERDPAGKITGIKHKGGESYPFGSERYSSTIHGDVREWADRVGGRHLIHQKDKPSIDVGQVSENEHGPILPEGKFMVQPAFAAVGISDAERAAGKTWHEKNEGRVHLLTKPDGTAEVIPHTTWLKGGNLPVVFEDDDTRAMAKAAQDAINALPAEARKGQVYAPDVMKTPDGYKVVELNAQGNTNGSGYLHDNHFTIDAYTSHLTGRPPMHVEFIRKLLTQKEGRTAHKPPTVEQARKAAQSDATGPKSARSPVTFLDVLKEHHVESLGEGQGEYGRWQQTPEVQAKHNQEVLQAAHTSGDYVPPEKFARVTHNSPNVGGQEHDVHFDKENNRYFKFTKGGHFGQNKDLPEYLERLEVSNQLWPQLNYAFHGVTQDSQGNPQAVTSMNGIKGVHPEQHEIENWFRNKGWVPDQDPSITEEDPAFGIRYWKDPATGTEIGDAHAKNFMKTADGLLLPIDVDILPAKKEEAKNGP